MDVAKLQARTEVKVIGLVGLVGVVYGVMGEVEVEVASTGADGDHKAF